MAVDTFISEARAFLSTLGLTAENEAMVMVDSVFLQVADRHGFTPEEYARHLFERFGFGRA